MKVDVVARDGFVGSNGVIRRGIHTGFLGLGALLVSEFPKFAFDC